MDAFKRRKAIRTVFTKLLNKYENVEGDELYVLYQQICEKYEQLKQLDEEIFDNCESESDLVKELEDQESYKEKFLKSKLKFQCSKKKEEADAKIKINKLNLPVIDPIKFDGNPKNWLPFWTQFKRIDSQDICSGDKYHYLINSLEVGSKARNLVSKFPATESGYKEAVIHLQERFGREDILVEMYVRELISLIITKPKSHKGYVTQLYDQVESQLRALNSLGVTRDKFSAILYPLVESALPTDVLMMWERTKSNFLIVSLEDNKSPVLNDSRNVKSVSVCSKLSGLMEFFKN